VAMKGLRLLRLPDVPVLGEHTIGDAGDVGRDPTPWPSMARKAAMDGHKFLVSEDHAVSKDFKHKCLVSFFNGLRDFVCPSSLRFEKVMLSITSAATVSVTPKIWPRMKGRRSSARGELAGLNRSDDLSELTVGFHVAVCFDNLVEWKDSVDDWLQGPFV
jgi:hypothetical protein